MRSWCQGEWFRQAIIHLTLKCCRIALRQRNKIKRNNLRLYTRATSNSAVSHQSLHTVISHRLVAIYEQVDLTNEPHLPAREIPVVHCTKPVFLYFVSSFAICLASTDSVRSSSWSVATGPVRAASNWLRGQPPVVHGRAVLVLRVTVYILCRLSSLALRIKLTAVRVIWHIPWHGMTLSLYLWHSMTQRFLEMA